MPFLRGDFIYSLSKLLMKWINFLLGEFIYFLLEERKIYSSKKVLLQITLAIFFLRQNKEDENEQKYLKVCFITTI